MLTVVAGKWFGVLTVTSKLILVSVSFFFCGMAQNSILVNGHRRSLSQNICFQDADHPPGEQHHSYPDAMSKSQVIRCSTNTAGILRWRTPSPHGCRHHQSRSIYRGSVDFQRKVFHPHHPLSECPIHLSHLLHRASRHIPGHEEDRETTPVVERYMYRMECMKIRMEPYSACLPTHTIFSRFMEPTTEEQHVNYYIFFFHFSCLILIVICIN